MAPQDDLTAERAAATEALHKIGCYWWPYRVEILLELMQQTRQEALREAENTVAGLMLDSQGQILDGDTLLLIHDALDRLASERA